MNQSFLDRRAMMTLMASALVAPAAQAGPVTPVVATTGLLAATAQALTGQPVRALVPPGIAPQGWRPGRAEAAMLAQARLVLANGLGLEGQMAPALARHTAQVVTEALPEGQLILTPEGQPDPHVWLDAALWDGVLAETARLLRDTLPDRADHVAQQEQLLRTEAARLHDRSANLFAALLPERRLLLTARPDWAYFARSHDITLHPFARALSAKAMGAAIETLVVELKDRGPIMADAALPARSLHALTSAAEAKGLRLRIALIRSTPADPQDGWASLVAGNLAAVARANSLSPVGETAA